MAIIAVMTKKSRKKFARPSRPADRGGKRRPENCPSSAIGRGSSPLSPRRKCPWGGVSAGHFPFSRSRPSKRRMCRLELAHPTREMQNAVRAHSWSRGRAVCAADRSATATKEVGVTGMAHCPTARPWKPSSRPRWKRAGCTNSCVPEPQQRLRSTDSRSGTAAAVPSPPREGRRVVKHALSLLVPECTIRLSNRCGVPH
jgi:hypothetical protein